MKKYFTKILVFFFVSFYFYPSFAQSLKDQRNDAFFTRAGDVLQIALPLSAAGYSLVIHDKDGLRSWFYSVASTAVLSYSLKYAVGRPRPFQDQNGRGDSFPSAHTAAAFSGAAYWQARYGWRVGIPAYALASSVGISRVWSGWHWWTDVAAGAVIGITFSQLFTAPYEKLQVSAGINPAGGHIAISGQF
jgi:membrane-associated phospholipid phosphatase